MIDQEQATGARPRGEQGRTRSRRRKKQKPACESCFFGCRGLCALDLGAPCATYRPDTPDGLLPPRQPALLLRESEDAALTTH